MTYIGLIAPSLKEGLGLEWDLLKTGRFKKDEIIVVVPDDTIDLTGKRFHGTIDIYNLIYSIEYKDWLAKNYLIRLYNRENVELN